MSYQNILSVQEIVPHVFLGPIEYTDSLKWLIKANIDRIVSIIDERASVTKHEIPIDYKLFLSDDYGMWNGKYVFNDILNNCVELIHETVSKGQNVYVHCLCGVNRSPTVVAAYLCKYKDMNLEQALSHISKKREVVHPNSRMIDSIKKWLNKK